MAAAAEQQLCGSFSAASHFQLLRFSMRLVAGWHCLGKGVRHNGVANAAAVVCYEVSSVTEAWWLKLLLAEMHASC